jgi:hypothetical protein
VEQYLADCKRRNLAEGTTSWYQRRLTKRLQRWWYEDVGILQGEMLEQVWNEIHDEYGPGTANGHVRTLKAFVRWLVEKGFIPPLPPRALAQVPATSSSSPRGRRLPVIGPTAARKSIAAFSGGAGAHPSRKPVGAHPRRLAPIVHSYHLHQSAPPALGAATGITGACASSACWASGWAACAA